ncbi:MAG: poly-beta-1,6 N-acetyl-D-glucosamine export porin PgaA [Woeseia sp.]|nr:poly-beta-1,6 N-acetyl-D-glucosamine export porin PgaA [Woeseia sp.]MBT8097610.1 poly-beta-1,6 N-acetyl-D-glucosamine export porin PgaA [Woeseia sp.]NNL55708.1 poly-beta-1,6 N-acetyl-D-glucosamine export porin PgaA [Woeseia sp.]
MSLAEEQEAAVLAARNGQFALALVELDRLRTEFPDNHSLLIDQTLVLSWAKKDAEVVANAHLIDQMKDATQVLAAIAKSYRNLQQFETGIEWYRMLQNREAATLDATLGLAMTLADAGRFAEANAELATLARGERESLPALRTQAYVFQLEGRDVECLPLYDAMLALRPGDRQTLRQKAFLLRDMRLPELALELAESYPALLSDEEIEHLQADVIALSIRSAARTYSPQGTEWQSSVQILARLDEHIADTPSGTAPYRRLRGDRLVALVDIGLMQEAIAEFQALSAEPTPMTRLERYSAAKAYLATGKPERARQLLLGCLQEAPNHYDCRVEYFYALLELRKFEEAQLEADAMVAAQPVINPETLKPNPKYLDARLRAVLARSYADRLDEAQEELEGITAAIPNNPSARAELASTYLWRGWPDRALSEFQQALTVYPQHVGARTGWTTTQLARQQYRQAGAEISQLQQQFPHSKPVQQLTRRWALHQKSTLVLDASLGDSTGSTFGSEQYTVQGWWYSPPVNDWYRIYLRSYDGFAELPEGNSHRSRAAAGIDYRRGDWRARSEISDERWGGDAGMSLEVNWRMSDLWSLAAVADVNSYDTPLRAYQNGVKSNQLQMRAGYAPNELFALGTSISYASFDDGNRRSNVSLYGQKRLINLPEFKLDATGSLFASQSTLTNASYFNPRADQSAVLGADMRWTRYFAEERRFYLRVFPQFGSYAQQSFASNPVWRLDLEVGVDFGRRMSLQLGVQRARHAYDGLIEYSDFLHLGIEARL